MTQGEAIDKRSCRQFGQNMATGCGQNIPLGRPLNTDNHIV